MCIEQANTKYSQLKHPEATGTTRKHPEVNVGLIFMPGFGLTEEIFLYREPI